MKKIKFLIITFISIVSIIACAKIDSSYGSDTKIINSKGEYAITFSNHATKSIASPAITHDYTSFNVYAWKDGAATDMFPYLVENLNNEWKYDNGNQELQYFDRNSEKYDFLGVITSGTVNPANGSVSLNVTGVKAFENNDDETTTPDELLWAQASVTKAAYDDNVTLTFNHANAKMYVGFVSDRNDTEIIDYAPGTKTLEQQARPFRAVAGDSNYGTKTPHSLMYNTITDEDILYINQYKVTVTSDNKVYNPTDSWLNYTGMVDATVEGDLNINMWEYLVNKYPELGNNGSQDLTWISINDNVNKRIIHAERAVLGTNNVVYFWVINKDNSKITIKDDGSTIKDIRVFSVSKDAQNKNIRTPHTTEASAVLGNNACVLTQTANSGDGADSNITFVKPTGAVAQVADFTTVNESTTVTWSPTVWYALPVVNPDNGYVVKFSYTYNGKTYYDARVHIPFDHSDFVQGKYYRYVICIGDKTNGTEDADDAKDEKDEVDTANLSIRFTVVVQEYGNGEFKTYVLGK